MANTDGVINIRERLGEELERRGISKKYLSAKEIEREMGRIISRINFDISKGANNIIKLDMSNEKVILSSYMQEIGSVEEILDRSFYKGDSLSISFSSKYATDALRAFNEPKVKILFTGAMKPFIVKDYEKDDLIQLVLPVRTY